MPTIGKKDPTAVKWHTLTVTKSGSYRYIRITGAQYGNIGEVEIYGTYEKSEIPPVQEEDPIDVSGLAVVLTASSNGYGNSATAEQCARKLFDGEPDTFGDLTNSQGDYYMIDFGKGVTVSLTGVKLYPRSTQANHASRMNNTVIYGSNDEVNGYNEKDWTQITQAVTGATMEVWHDAQLLDTTAYRFFKIAGAEQGDIAEVQFYGTVDGTAEEETPIDVKGLVDAKSATWTEQTDLLFDGSTTNNGEPKSAEYTIDFGAGATVTPTKFKVYPRSDKDAEYVNRLNGVKFQGSNDNDEWVDITIALDGLKTKDTEALTWHTLPVMKSGSWRYIRITGASYGNIAEVKIYGDYTKVDVPAVPEASLIDVSKLAVVLTASSNGWSNTATAEKCAQSLFDGDTETFNSLQNAQGDYYMIDFGKGVTVSLTGVKLYPRSTATNHASRLNNTVIYGSNDEKIVYAEKDWTQITQAVTGAAMNEWHDAQLLDTTAYRFFMIAGAEQGDIAEVQFYGTVNGTAEDEDPIDVKGLVDAKSATWTDQTDKLFDDKLDTNGEPSSAEYTIDFGDGVTITPTKFMVYPRLGSPSGRTEAEYVDRLNGTKFQGSNDNSTWVDITIELNGIQNKDAGALMWHTLPVMKNAGSYRYIRITGATVGNIAEVRIYGTYNKSEENPMDGSSLVGYNGAIWITGFGEDATVPSTEFAVKAADIAPRKRTLTARTAQISGF